MIADYGYLCWLMKIPNGDSLITARQWPAPQLTRDLIPWRWRMTDRGACRSKGK
ncbi:MAG: hypothetical protein SXG53_06920 [Pseudomonadota bacterium]|nr:hypothetical protein [Pseudomonadota bacterium]